MKKLYTIALAAAVALSATAAGQMKLNSARFSELKPVNVENVKKAPQPQAINTARLTESFNSNISTMDKNANGTFTINGDYKLNIGDYYRGEESVGSIKIDVTIEGTRALTITDNTEEWFMSDVYARYESLTNTVTVSAEMLGTLGQYYVYFTPFKWTTTNPVTGAGRIDPVDQLNGKFDPKTGVIDFGVDYGFEWLAYSDAEATDLLGVFVRFDVMKANQIDPDAPAFDEVQEGQWETLEGTAILHDAWFTTRYSYNTGEFVQPEEFPVTCVLQRDVNNPNRFRLWEPFNGNPTHLDTAQGANISSYHGQIVFDITDNDHVIVEAGMPAGLATASYGELYAFSPLGWFINYLCSTYGVDRVTAFNAAVSSLEEEGEEFDTYDPETRTVTIPTSVFADDAECSNMYSWNGTPYTTSKIMLPESAAVRDIIVTEGNSNGKVEYFNLQGVRMENPAAGQLVIKKEGNNVSKVLVK